MLRRTYVRPFTRWRAIRASLLMLLMLGFTGCKCGERTAMNNEMVPEDLNIIFGRQGTFAGRSMGYSIDADGRVTRWEGKYPGEIEQAEADISEDEVRRIWKQIEAIGFLDMSYQAMTTEGPFINVSAGGESRRVTWTGQSDDVPAGVQDLYDQVTDVARTALGEAEAGESN